MTMQNTTPRDTNRALLVQFFQTLDHEGYREGFLAALHDDVVFNVMGQSPMAGRYEGKEAYKREGLAKLHARVVKSAQITPLTILIDGDMACARFQSRGGKGVNGFEFGMDYCWVFHIVDSRIKEIWGYYDTAQMIALFAD